MIYNALILPHLNYNIMTWGHKLHNIVNLQKRAIRSVANSQYNAHTEPILKLLNMLKLEDIYKVAKLKFFYKHTKNMLPNFFQIMRFPKVEEGHDIDLRNKNDRRLPAVKKDLTNTTIKYMIPDIINKTPTETIAIMELICYGSFSEHVKKQIIDSYTETCDLIHCYSCGKP